MTPSVCWENDRRQLERLDELLVEYRDVVTGNAPPDVTAPRSRWWWHLGVESSGPPARAPLTS